MTDPAPKPRWFHLTPDRFVIGLLIVVCLLWLSERFGWLLWHKGYAVLIAVASVGVVFIGMLLGSSLPYSSVGGFNSAFGRC